MSVPIRLSRSILFGSLVVIPLAATAFSQTPARPSSEPRLPGAVESAPAWLKDAPFDVAAFFAMPPAAENAAPLYLEAFAEFDGDVADCFPPDRRGPAQAAAARWKRLTPIYDAWAKDPSSVTPAQVDAMLAEFKEGFRKLDLAQRRPRCVFAQGILTGSSLSHAKVSRNVVRLLIVRISRELERDEFDAALADLGRIFRLSRDLRPRGESMSQIVSHAEDSVTVSQGLPHFLSYRKLKPEQCDRLIKLLAEHEAKLPDSFTIAAQAEYILFRSSLRAIGEGIQTTLDDQGKPVEKNLGAAGKTANAIDLIKRVDGTEADALKLDASGMLEPTALALDRKIAEEFARAMLAKPTTYADRVRRSDLLQKKYLDQKTPTLSRLLTPNYPILALSTTRDRLYFAGAQCLVALRRRQLVSPNARTDLAEACKAAKLPGIPNDPFGNGPLKLGTIAGEPVVYSIGPDGKDDAALKDARMGANPEGDLIFRLPGRKAAGSR